ncbi:NifB/NifX family molybdenum-iron cluster-binding protein [Asaccharospora irregularis]|uniref:Predicted Fe-Mo cluster-binding protein, NifX family n=1 Tax=Asaccharospora irregularis DSM 2635 TaxID=1121321 RepID=A0A1M5PIW5_9FIRM|nr:NifB/NifX family molybdenum-iron cluster-binding protein [Asaccharospora irregularis]SHH01671.1 Predicted Fe-Mo cluster-binding protein, NifX family [Asaccharospora irregularis DSM 2635]
MKICIPVEENKGLESAPFGHFGSAPMFLVCDLEKNELTPLDNGDLGHEHGKCQPMKALSGNVVDAVIVGGIGQGAIIKLGEMGIKVYRAKGETIKENLELFKEGKLEEFASNHSCNHDDCGHH